MSNDTTDAERALKREASEENAMSKKVAVVS